MTNEEKEKRKENFQEWLFAMDDQLNELFKIFKKDEKIDLQYDSDSLGKVESWILKNFDSKEDLLLERNKHLLNKLAIFVGETFRKNIGGKWKLDLGDEKSAYYKLPILTESMNLPSPIAPHTLVTACISRTRVITSVLYLIEN